MEPWYTRFSRVSSSGPVLPQLDGLRFVAIAAVVLFHCDVFVRAYAGPFTYEGGALPAVAAVGNLGVQLFFVISGFILSLPVAGRLLTGQDPPPLGPYFRRRLVRIEPPYLLSLLLLFGLNVAYGHSARELLPHLLAGLAYLHGTLFGEPNPVSSVTWSLEVEVQFYLLAPFLAAGFFRLPTRLRRFSLTSALGVSIALLHMWDRPVLATSLLPQLPYFLAGFLLTEVYLSQCAGRAWDLATLGWPLVVLLPESTRPLWLPPLLLLLCAAALMGPLTRRVLSFRGISIIGGMCYAIYLLHYAVLAGVGHAGLRFVAGESHAGTLARFALVVAPVVLGVSAAWFVAIERPFMRRAAER